MGADSEQGKKYIEWKEKIDWAMLGSRQTFDAGFQAGVESVKAQAAEIVIREIESSTGPTGGWLDSPKAICASIVASLTLQGRKQEK